MLQIAIDALALICLLKVISDEDIEFAPACGLSFVAAIITTVLAVLLVGSLGLLLGLVAAALMAATLFGVAVSAWYGVEIKRSFLIGVIFVVVHIGTAIGLQMAFSR
jgi:hypothetical protein